MCSMGMILYPGRVKEGRKRRFNGLTENIDNLFDNLLLNIQMLYIASSIHSPVCLLL